jgi:hypothetical protein
LPPANRADREKNRQPADCLPIDRLLFGMMSRWAVSWAVNCVRHIFCHSC